MYIQYNDMDKLANIFKGYQLQPTNLKEKNVSIEMEFFILCVSSFPVAVLNTVYLHSGFQCV